MRFDDPSDERTYLYSRAVEWAEAAARREGRSRRDVLKFTAAAVPALVSAALLPPAAAAAPRRSAKVAPAAGSPIVKPLPPEWFINYGTNAEMRWDTVDFGYLTPTERFFVRDHTATALIDRRTWQLAIFGTGLRNTPAADQPLTLSFEQLLSFRPRTVVSAIECAGNGRSFFGSQQNTPVGGTQWKLGAVGVAEWTGVPLSTILEWAGVTPAAVDVLPVGLDNTVVVNGADVGHVRRPFPISKALDDVLVAYAMNGRWLPPDHGGPARVIVPGWAGVANIKWLGQLEVADHPLYSTWNTTQYRLIGPDYPPDQPPITAQVVKSAFQLAWNATFPAGRRARLQGRSWSGLGAIAGVDVSTDSGRTWRPAQLEGPNQARTWTRWSLPWTPGAPGPTQLLARASDTAGRTQPDTVPFNTGGYLFGAVVKHPVTVVAG